VASINVCALLLMSFTWQGATIAMKTTNHPSGPQTATPEASAPIATADEVIAQLYARHGLKGSRANERSSERFPWVTSLALVIIDPQGTPRTLEVLTHDISAGGFSFVYRQFLHVGSMVRAEFTVLPNRPRLDGIVRNCVHVGGINHRIGVQFTGVEG